MSGIKGKEYILVKKFHGKPTPENYEVKEFELPELKDGEFAMEVTYLTVDPYMRIPAFTVEGQRMPGEGVGVVVQSKNADFPVKSKVMGKTGWATHVVGNAQDLRILPNDIPQLYYFLGPLGMPGLTAYVEIQKTEPKSGDVFFVNASAGAVGSVVGQMAKRKGCKVVGCAGSDEKVAYLKTIGFDEAFNYKTNNFAEAMKAACPDGIDCFVDHVGGSQYDTVMPMMKFGGRVALVGEISGYNETEKPPGHEVHMPAIGKELTIRGVIAFAHYHEYPTFHAEYLKLVVSGEIKSETQIYKGFEKMNEAFLSLFSGSHIGKVVVQL
ncbi:prostaglandin reductase 1-like [Clytia hemisphaerica]|uniref:15-oxoprostaglandin 13-reductase n=1 Tax=Clytia hemisphaerica TaxID=252671 RepID=A0A7M5UTC0_9CNID